MSDTAEKTDPALWDKVKQEVTEGSKGGKAGQWSARKAQMAVAEYQRHGGGYKGERDPHNSLHEWTEQDWSTKSGSKSKDSGERYLPKKALETLSDEDYARTTAAKRTDTKKGKQFSAQPKDVAIKAKAASETRADLYAQATRRGIAGRSRMTKAQLAEALAG